MFCPNCGARNSEADTNCQKCGFNLKEQAGAKFKGTMLMMNNASAMAAELRRSAPPGAAQPGPPPNTPEAKPLTPEAAKQVRAQLKGTMIGVAPPAIGANKPAVGVTVPRPSSRPPAAPLGSGPLPPRQPGPGQVNAPGAGIHRGGATIIGTGIAPAAFGAPAPFGAPPASATPLAPQATPGGAPAGGPTKTEALTVSEDPFSVSASGEAQAPSSAFDKTHVSPSAPQAPAVASNAPSGVGTGAMSSFDSAASATQALSGTLVAGSGISSTELFGDEPQFASDAGKRTNTPAMGVPTANVPTTQSPVYESRGSDSYTGRNDTFISGAPRPPSSKELALTMLTCGLYKVYKKFKAKNS